MITLGFLSAEGVSLTDGVARIVYVLPQQVASEPMRAKLSEITRGVVLELEGVRDVRVEFNVQPAQPESAMSGVKHVVAVGAGKGGVGKSTVAAMLAFGLHRLGHRTGLLDADVYGPSLPKITGTESAQANVDADGRIIPPEAGGVPIMSMGYLVPPDQAVIWRGPMAQKYVKEFLDRGCWGELDYLIVDLPPGTGDIPLTLAQSIPLTGAIIVCTPQDIALLDAVKALRMYQKLDVQPLGLVENMSFYICPQCGHRAEIFDHGGCRKAAEELNVPFLGGIPLNVEIRRNCDQGKPIDNFTKGDPHVIESIEKIVRDVAEQVDQVSQAGRALPQVRIV